MSAEEAQEAIWEPEGAPSIYTHKSSAEPVTPNDQARSSRAKGHINTVHYPSARRKPDGDYSPILVNIGDSVTIDYDACHDRRVTSDLLVWTDKHANRTSSSSTTARKGKGKPKNSKKEAPDARDAIDDGITNGCIFGLVADIFEDAGKELLVRMQWFYRPRIALSTWPKGAFEKLGLSVANNELFYATDPSALRRGKHESQAQDVLPISYIVEHFNLDDWVISRFWNPVPATDQDWVQEFDFPDVHAHALRTGVWELAVEGDEEDEQQAAKRKKNYGQSKARKRKAPAQEEEASDEEEEPSSDEDNDEDAQVDSSTSDGESDGSGHSASSSEPESSSEEDEPEEVEDDLPARGTKRKAAKSWGAGRTLGAPKTIKMSAEARKRHQARLERRKARIQSREFRRAAPSFPEHTKQLEGWTDFQKARSVLHVGATPDHLPGREGEFAEIEAYLEDAIDEGVGSCIYIAGVPGTGKTATVRSVVRILNSRAESNEIQPFRFIEINGMKLTEPQQAFSHLWEFISGDKAGQKTALGNLESHFKTPSPGRETCVVLVDELDRLVTKKNEVIYNLFNWPNQPHSRLIVIAIANTMDLPERQLNGKIRSRLGSNRINFMPYNHTQLADILRSRLTGLPDTVIDSGAIDMASKSVARITGDARRALDICRRAIEKVESEGRKVSIRDVQAVQKEMTASGPGLWVREAPLMQKVLLLAVTVCTKKKGVESVTVSDAVQWHVRFLKECGLQPEPTEEQFLSMTTNLCAMKLLSADTASCTMLQQIRPEVREDDLMNALKQDPQLERRVSRITL